MTVAQAAAVAAESSAGELLLEVSNIEVVYNKAVQVLRGLSLTVPISNPDLRTPAGSSVAWDDDRAAEVFDAIRDDDTERIRPIAA